MANQITTFLDPTQLPSRLQDQDTFDTFMALLMQLLPTWGSQINTVLANINASSSGSAYAIPYTIDLSGTSDIDPGSGKLRFDSATQNLATTLRLDLLGNNNVDYTAMLDTFDASTSAVRGTIRLIRYGDPTSFLMFSVTARTAPTGYRDISVTPVASSSANPFVNGDGVLLYFQRTGDKGNNGTLARRVAPVQTNPAALTPDISNYDVVTATALAQSLTINAPTGTPTDGQTLVIRIKDNGTLRSIAMATIYRASNELPFPNQTNAGKQMYMGFTYNATDVKWDLLALIANM